MESIGKWYVHRGPLDGWFRLVSSRLLTLGMINGAIRPIISTSFYPNHQGFDSVVRGLACRKPLHIACRILLSLHILHSGQVMAGSDVFISFISSRVQKKSYQGIARLYIILNALAVMTKLAREVHYNTCKRRGFVAMRICGYMDIWVRWMMDLSKGSTRTDLARSESLKCLRYVSSPLSLDTIAFTPRRGHPSLQL